MLADYHRNHDATAAHIGAHNPSDNANASSSEARLLRCGASGSVDFSDGEADLGAKLAFIGSPFPVIGSAIGPPAPAGWADLAPCRVKRLSETASRSCPPEMLWLERGRRPSRERASSKHPGNKKTFVNQFFNF